MGGVIGDAGSSSPGRRPRVPASLTKTNIVFVAGSTNAVVYCTTGVADPVTSAMHIAMGKYLMT